jgi:uncharacterized protein
LIRRHDVRTLPVSAWKNGDGGTREIVRVPADAGFDDFDWRASIATIAVSGRFSEFPGVDRTIVLLDGGGLHLRSGASAGIDHRLDAPLAPFAFAGDVALEATLVAGASTDFNLMVRRDRCRADVRVVRTTAKLPQSAAGVVHVVAGCWSLANDGGEATATLEAGEGLAWQDVHAAWMATPTSDAGDAALLFAGIEAVPR